MSPPRIGTPEYEIWKQSPIYESIRQNLRKINTGKISPLRGKPSGKKGISCPSKLTGKTYLEIYGEERARELVAIRSRPGKPLKKDKQCICKYCNSIFFGKQATARHCDRCLERIEVECSCGCKKTTIRVRWDVESGRPVLLSGHNAKFFKKSKLEDAVATYLYGWKRQYPIGDYSVDFALPGDKKVIEVNGCFWHACPLCNITSSNSRNKEVQDKIRRIDARRLKYISSRGWDIEILWEHDVKTWIESRKVLKGVETVQ